MIASRFAKGSLAFSEFGSLCTSFHDHPAYTADHPEELESMLEERDLCQRIIDFSFIIKERLHSRETEVLKSILCVLIMEAEDSLEQLSKEEEFHKGPKRNRSVA